MSKRNSANSSLPASMDSFMDIVFNVLGGIFIVVIYAAISTAGLKAELTLPMTEPAKTTPVFFECRGDRAFFPDIHALHEESNVVWKASPPGEQIERLMAADISNAFYRYQVKANGTRLSDEFFEPTPGAHGERAHELVALESKFRKKLSEFDSSTHHVYFIVRTDSFAVFHTARRVAAEMGFNVGYQPWELDGIVRVGGSGGHGGETG